MLPIYEGHHKVSILRLGCHHVGQESDDLVNTHRSKLLRELTGGRDTHISKRIVEARKCESGKVLELKSNRPLECGSMFAPGKILGAAEPPLGLLVTCGSSGDIHKHPSAPFHNLTGSWNPDSTQTSHTWLRTSISHWN